MNSTPQQPGLQALEARWPLQPVSFCLSVLIHTAIVVALIFIPPVVQAEKPIAVALYKTLKLKKTPIIYWAPDTLPAVSPETPIGGNRQFRGEQRSPKERVVVERPNSDSSKQLVWQPDKPNRLQQETPLKNLVAVKGKLAPKLFAPPPVRPRPRQAPKSLSAPEMQPQKAEALPSSVVGLSSLPSAKPPPKAFVAPKERPRLALQPGVVADAPPELTQAQGRDVKEIGSALGSGTLPRKPAPFVPPSGSKGGGSGTEGGKDLSAPPEVSSGGTGSAVTVAVIGLDQAAKLASLPYGSREASFSRAPETGRPSGGTSGDGPVIPGVAIAGNRRAASVAPLPSPPSVSGGNRTVAVRIPTSAMTMSVPLRPASRVLPREIESRFASRIVYTLVIPKPNFPEYAADWTIWFAERGTSSTVASAIRPPVPILKTIRGESLAPPATLPGTWVQVSAVIGKDGKVGGIAPVLGRNPAVAARAAEDLANWEFRPAQRNGEAVEIEVVIEIPFRFQ